MSTTQANKPFEIGLVGAGAISAGAYTGGVMDYLVFALDAWYAAKAKGDEAVPPHDIQLGVFSGASAGAITAALSTAYLGSQQPSIASPQVAEQNKGKNKLFHSWVEQIDIKYLLEQRDLEGNEQPVVSLLDSTILSTIADDGLNVEPRQQRRPYVAPKFELLMTVTNLRGIPYALKVGADAESSYDMSLHADYVHFRISDEDGAEHSDRYAMRWSDFKGDSTCKDKMKVSALASGAFPVGLAPRTLDHQIKKQSDWYSARSWPVSTPESEHPHSCVTFQTIPANWPQPPSDFSYTFQCVDGGVMNNEPFELARKQLAGAGGRNERDPSRADKAVLMIDPFPSDSSFDGGYKAAEDLLGSAIRLFGALKNQARFKPEELMLAANQDVASRYMIAPRRDGKAFPIACGSLGGFGGFLKRDFRCHDYFLGRRNAQKFLLDHFALPQDNPLFKDWTDAQRAQYCVKDKDGNPRRKDGMLLLPIIPLVGEARAECLAPKWPAYSKEDIDGLMDMAEKRLEAVSKRMVGQYFKHNPILAAGAKFILWSRKKDILGKIKGLVEGDLRKMELM